MTRTLRVAMLEPYYGGSHAAFADALKVHSRHQIELLTLPARKWKWRMRGAAIWFAREAGQWLDAAASTPIDVILCSDMLSVADLRALLPPIMRQLPIVCYFHENQLTYPMPPDQDRDYQYGMTNITSCLAADAVWFNSRFHLEDFLAAADRLLRKMPDYVPAGVVQNIRSKADVIPPPIVATRFDRPAARPDRPVTILWSHRWEYDKNPEPFFDAVIRLAEAGLDFNLVLTGEQFRTAPRAFANAWPRLERHIAHAGFIPDRSTYLKMLTQCDVVVSTAIQENFGIAIAEAILAGCQPLLPDRLAYPELIPSDLRGEYLYPSDADLYERLETFVQGKERAEQERVHRLQAHVEEHFGAQNVVPSLDDALQDVADSRG